jgi:glucokinase
MYLGIEIGGTKLQLGLGPGDGTLAALWRGGVDVARGGEGIREQIVREVPALLDRAGVACDGVRGVGVGFGGPVDDADQTVIKSHQIEGWDGFPLARWLTGLLGWPVALGNDADVAGLGEALFGAGKGLSPIFYITVGSGIGGGLIINGEIYRGSGRGAAEIGHLQIRDEFHAHDASIVEEFASGWSVARAYDFYSKTTIDPRMLEQVTPSWVSGEEARVTAAEVGRLAEAKNALACRVLHQAWVNLATAICNTIALLGPRRIVIGGGVSLMGEWLLFEPLRTLVAARVFKPFANCYDIVPAALGEEVVVHGALALARKRLGG